MIRRALYILGVIPVGILAMILWVWKGGDRADNLMSRFDQWGT